MVIFMLCRAMLICYITAVHTAPEHAPHTANCENTVILVIWHAIIVICYAMNTVMDTGCSSPFMGKPGCPLAQNSDIQVITVIFKRCTEHAQTQLTGMGWQGTH